MNKHVKSVLTVIIVLIVLFLIALPKLSFLDEDNKAATPQTKAMPGGGIPVEVVVADPTTLDNTINITGAVLANESIELTSEVAGKVVQAFISKRVIKLQREIYL